MKHPSVERYAPLRLDTVKSCHTNDLILEETVAGHATNKNPWSNKTNPSLLVHSTAELVHMPVGECRFWSDAVV